MEYGNHLNVTCYKCYMLHFSWLGLPFPDLVDWNGKVIFSRPFSLFLNSQVFLDSWLCPSPPSSVVKKSWLILHCAHKTNKNLAFNIKSHWFRSKSPDFLVYLQRNNIQADLSDEGGLKSQSANSPWFDSLLEAICSHVDNEDKGVAKCDPLGEKQQTEQRTKEQFCATLN